MSVEDEVRVLKIEAGDVHGDAHFGNFLVDASIPEDPLVVSIDPGEISINDSDPAVRQFASGLDLDTVDISRALTMLRRDPTYDFSKLLVSTSSFYGLASKRAFTVGNLPNAVWSPFSRALAKACFVLCYVALIATGTVALTCASLLIEKSAHVVDRPPITGR